MDARIREAANNLAKSGDIPYYVSAINRYLNDLNFDPMAQAPATMGFVFELYIGAQDNAKPIVADTIEKLKEQLKLNKHGIWHVVRGCLDRAGNLLESTQTYYGTRQNIRLYRVPTLYFGGRKFSTHDRSIIHQIPFKIARTVIDEVFGKDIAERRTHHLEQIAKKKEASAKAREKAERQLERQARHRTIREIRSVLAAGNVSLATSIIEASRDEEVRRIGPHIIRAFNK